MDQETDHEPPAKMRRTKDPVSPSPKKLKVKTFAQVSYFNKSLKIKQEIESDHEIEDEELTHVNRLTASCIEEDDEVWIVQCPVDMDPTSLMGESLTFSETCMLTDSTSAKQYDIQTNSSQKKVQCILPRNTGTGFEICNLNVNGMLIVSESPSCPQVSASVSEEDVKETFIHPPNVMLRNPHLLPEEISKLKHKGTKRKSKKVLAE